MFYCAMNDEESIVWQDGEQTLNPKTFEIEPIGFVPTFVCEWDGVSKFYTLVYGELTKPIPFAGWDMLKAGIDG